MNERPSGRSADKAAGEATGQATGRRTRGAFVGAALVAVVAVVWWVTRPTAPPEMPNVDPVAGRAAAERSAGGPPKVMWERTYGGEKIDAARAIRVVPGGGYVVVARTRSRGAGKDDIWLLRLDDSGAVTWQRTFGDSGKNWATDVAIMPDGGFAIAGSSERGTEANVAAWLIRTDSGGKQVWEKRLGGIRLDGVTSVTALPGGGLLAAGSVSSKGAGGYDAWLLRFAANGDLELEKLFGGRADDSAFVALPLKDGYAVAGSTASAGQGGGDMWLLRLDAKGDLVWSKTYGGPKYDVANVLLVMPDGGFLLAGHSASGEKALPLVVRVDKDGKVVWQTRVAMAHEGWANTGALLGDGGIVLAGLSKDREDGDENAWVARLDKAGKVLWLLPIAYDKDDNLLSIAPLKDGGFIAAGFTNSKGAGGGDVWLVRLGYPGAATPAARR